MLQMEHVHKMFQRVSVCLGGNQEIVDMCVHESLKSRWSMQVVETLFQP